MNPYFEQTQRRLIVIVEQGKSDWCTTSDIVPQRFHGKFLFYMPSLVTDFYIRITKRRENERQKER
jgi:hypothetical protein